VAVAVAMIGSADHGVIVNARTHKRVAPMDIDNRWDTN
jgi:hypothetical protein